MKLYKFRTVPLSIIRSYSPYTQQWYVIQTKQAQIPRPSVGGTTPDDGQRNCLKHGGFHLQNKSEKLLHLVGFIIRKFVTMHGHVNLKKKLFG
jgi:hypothetical protein